MRWGKGFFLMGERDEIVVGGRDLGWGHDRGCEMGDGERGGE